MTEVGKAAPAPQQPAGWARALLLITIVIEFFEGLSTLPILAGNLNDVPGPGLGGAIVVATIILHPIVAAGALYFLIRGQLTTAILCLVLVVVLNWVSYLPSVALHGMDVSPEPTSVIVTFIILILPPLVGLSVPPLLSRQQITPAILLAVLPTVIGVLSVLAFGIGVAIYGF